MTDLTHSTHETPFTGNPLAALASPRYAPALSILTEADPLPPAKRLVVILPDADFDMAALPQRIWELSGAGSRSVLLMIRPNSADDQFYAQMNLTTLAAIIRDTHFEVQTQLVLGQSLEQAACQLVQPEDVFVCFEAQQVGGRLNKRRLAESLAQATQRPVYTLKGTVREHASSLPARLSNALFMLVCLLILAAFFALQIWIDKNSSGTMNTVLMLLSVFVEISIIGVLATRGRML